MEFRRAVEGDLPQLTAVYRQIIAHMERQGICIWDEVYPCSFFGEDIAQNRLYLLAEGAEILAAFALCTSNDGAGEITWGGGQEKALYLDRLGVNAAHRGKGLGAAALRYAALLAGEMGAKYLRLFVVDCNEPAIRLYQKSGFRQAEGVYDEVIEDDLVLHEFGFEIGTDGAKA